MPKEYRRTEAEPELLLPDSKALELASSLQDLESVFLPALASILCLEPQESALEQRLQAVLRLEPELRRHLLRHRQSHHRRKEFVRYHRKVGESARPVYRLR